jgi:hypothetical protein
MAKIDIEAEAYDSSEPVGLDLALGPTMTVGRCCTSTVLTCTCGSLPEIVRE